MEHSPASATPSLSINTSTINILNEFVRGGVSNGVTVNSGLTYSNGSTLRYTLGSARNVSGEWVAPSGVDNVINASSANVTLSSSRAIPSDGSIIINQTSGSFIVSGGTTVLLVNGDLERRTSGTNGITLASGGQVQYATTGSNLSYNTSANTTIGSEWPAAGSSPPENVEITITGGGTLSSSGALSRTIAQDLILNVGTVNLGAGTLTVAGTVAGSEVTGSAVINDNTTLFIGNSGTGNTNGQTITGNLTLNKFTVDKRNGTNAADSTVTLSGILTFTANGSFNISQGIFDFNAPGALAGTLSSLNLTIGSNGVLKTGGTTLTGITGTINTASGKIVFDGASSVETMPAWTLSRLEVDNSFGVATSTGTMIVSQVLRLTNGIVTTTPTKLLRLGASAVVAGTPGATKMVVGPLRKVFSGLTSFTFPVGSGTSYAPATFQYTSGTVTASIIEIQHSGVTFTEKTLPGSITAIHKPEHYILRERGTPASGFTYAFTGTFPNNNFNPESRNNILVENQLFIYSWVESIS